MKPSNILTRPRFDAHVGCFHRVFLRAAAGTRRRLRLAQHRRAEDVSIEFDGALYVSNNEGVRHYKLEPSALIGFGHHNRLLFEPGCSMALSIQSLRDP